MFHPVFSFGQLRRVTVALLVFAGACGDSNQTSPSETGVPAGDPSASAPVDSTAIPGDSVPVVSDPATPADSAPPSADSCQTDTTGLNPLTTSTGSGIPFGQNNRRAADMTAMYNGTQLGITAPNFLNELR